MSEQLDRLIAAVEAGTVTGETPHAGIDGLSLVLAYKGSLDAAKALHDALLPGWPMVYLNRYGSAPHRWSAEIANFGKLSRYTRRSFLERGNCPARTWLLVILRAYKETQA